MSVLFLPEMDKNDAEKRGLMRFYRAKRPLGKAHCEVFGRKPTKRSARSKIESSAKVLDLF
jgi:hypothetical protein